MSTANFNLNKGNTQRKHSKVANQNISGNYAWQ